MEERGSEGWRDGGTKRGKEGMRDSREGTRAKPGNQLVIHNYCPCANAFLCKKAAYILIVPRRHEWQYNMLACFGQVQPKNG